MSFDKQMLFMHTCFFLALFCIRNVLWAVKTLYMGDKERKRRRTGQTFKEWFLYSRYRDEIPKILLWLYFIVVTVHPLSLACVWVARFIESFRGFTSVLTIAIIAFDAFWLILIVLQSWKPGSPNMHYELWISKEKVKKKR